MRSSESGNAVFIILVAVALLAALSFAVSQGGRGSVEILSEERARLYASEIIEYSNIVSSAVAQVRLRGFTDEQISFENDIVSGYTNANCTSDVCKVFHLAGGGVNWAEPIEGANDGSNWFYTGRTCVVHVGTGGTGCNTSQDSSIELMMFLPNLNVDVCVQINDLLGIDNPSGAPAQENSNSYSTIAAGQFTGAYDTNYSISGSPFSGTKSACYEGGGTDPTPGTYHFYKVLITR